jgi:tetratricopeptide (TPR) repeat protein
MRYAEFLMAVDSGNPKFIERAIELLTEAESLERQALTSKVDDPALKEDAINSLALVYRYMARCRELTGNEAATRANYESSLEQYRQLVSASPNRFSFKRNYFSCANAYSDYLILAKADPALINRLCTSAMQTLSQMLQTPEMLELEQIGLAQGHYRLGLTNSMLGNESESQNHFRMSELMRQKAYREAASQLAPTESTLAMTAMRIDWLLSQARLGMVEDVTKAVEELSALTLTDTPSATRLLKKEILIALSAATGILSETHEVQQDHTRVDSLRQQAISFVERGMEAGYQDANYLTKDPDFAWLERTGELQSILQKIRLLQNP